MYQVSDDLNKFKLDYIGYQENLSSCPSVVPIGVKVSGFVSENQYKVGYQLYSKSLSSKVSLDTETLETFTASDTSREFLNLINITESVSVFVVKFIIEDLTNSTSESNYFIFRCP